MTQIIPNFAVDGALFPYEGFPSKPAEPLCPFEGMTLNSGGFFLPGSPLFRKEASA